MYEAPISECIFNSKYYKNITVQLHVDCPTCDKGPHYMLLDLSLPDKKYGLGCMRCHQHLGRIKRTDRFDGACSIVVYSSVFKGCLSVVKFEASP